MKTDNRNPQKDWQDEALDQLLADAKDQFDEAWMKEAESHMPSGMEERLRQTIARLEEQEACPTTMQQAPRLDTPVVPSEPPRLTLKRRWYQVAACALLLLSIGIGVGIAEIDDNAFTDTCATPEEAQVQLERALVTLHMNGKRAVKQARRTIRQTGEVQQQHTKYIKFSEGE